MTFRDDDDDRLESTPDRFPYVKLTSKGDEFRMSIADYDTASPVFEYGTTTQKRAITSKGTERTKDVLTGVLLPGSTCTVAMPGKGDVPAAPGMVVRMHIQGHNRYDTVRTDAWRNAKDSHGDFRVGDIVRGVLADVTLQGLNGITLSQPKKVISFAMRKPRDEDMPYVAMARDERRRLRESQRELIDNPTPAATTATTPAPAQSQLAQPQPVAAVPAQRQEDLW